MRRLKHHLQSIRVGIVSEQPLEVGKALTKIFLTIVVILAFLPQHTDTDGWDLRLIALLVSPANEIGDTFAGIAGVLAFLWIIITVWLQSQELAAQREELRLTRLELGEQRKATQDMARAMSAQAEASETVQEQRSQNAAKDLLDQLLKNFIVHCYEGNFGTWRYHRISGDGRTATTGQKSALYDIDPSSHSVDRCVQLITRNSLVQIAEVLEYSDSGFIIECPDSRESYVAVADRLRQLVEMRPRLSESQQERLTDLNLAELLQSLDKLLNNSNLWSDQRTKEE